MSGSNTQKILTKKPEGSNMPEIDFDLIYTTGENVINISGYDYGRPANLHNATIASKAEAEYLNELLKLQKHIKEKYESELVNNVLIEGEPDDDKIWDIQYEDRSKLLEDGADNLYYNT